MARTTVAQLEAQFNELKANVATADDLAKIASMVGQLAVSVNTLAANVKPKDLQPAPEKPKRKIEWLSDFPDYGTPAQRVEYEKLAAKAADQRAKIAKAMGVEYVSCFIPVSKKADVMPHSIKWAANYK